MNGHAAHRGPPPDVDEGDARDLAAVLRRELRPTPGRLGDSLRIVVVLLIVVAISETFRIPDIALSAYIVLFLSGREAVSTVRTALISSIAAVLAIFATIAVFMLSLSEPALRIPLMAVTTFGAMFLAVRGCWETGIRRAPGQRSRSPSGPEDKWRARCRH